MTISKQTRWQKLFGYGVGYQATWIGDIGMKTGLFEAIAEAGEGVDAGRLAAELDYDERYVRLWCRAAFASAGLRDAAPDPGNCATCPPSPTTSAGRRARSPSWSFGARRRRDGRVGPAGVNRARRRSRRLGGHEDGAERSGGDGPDLWTQLVAWQPPASRETIGVHGGAGAACRFT